uniref:Uncharacterized protein n=1 Tax=Anguilla anguilla TaxID=7936 RepID=A0A0E9SK23_ANGAN
MDSRITPNPVKYISLTN